MLNACQQLLHPLSIIPAETTIVLLPKKGLNVAPTGISLECRASCNKRQHCHDIQSSNIRALINMSGMNVVYTRSDICTIKLTARTTHHILRWHVLRDQSSAIRRYCSSQNVSNPFSLSTSELSIPDVRGEPNTPWGHFRVSDHDSAQAMISCWWRSIGSMADCVKAPEWQVVRECVENHADHVLSHRSTRRPTRRHHVFSNLTASASCNIILRLWEAAWQEDCKSDEPQLCVILNENTAFAGRLRASDSYQACRLFGSTKMSWPPCLGFMRSDWRAIFRWRCYRRSSNTSLHKCYDMESTLLSFDISGTTSSRSPFSITELKWLKVFSKRGKSGELD